MALAEPTRDDVNAVEEHTFGDKDTRRDEMATAIDEFADQLLDDAEQAVESEAFQDWLDAKSKFHDYSDRNTLLIQMQMPDATHVAGYNTWQELGRQVQQGEEGIWIWSPIFAQKCPSCGNAPGYHDRVSCTRNESDDTDEWQRGVVGFRPTTVFDISQTEGDELPELECETQGEADGLVDDILAAAGNYEFDVSVVDPDAWEWGSNKKGVCYKEQGSSSQSIEAPDRDNQADLARTLIHEYAHALLHKDSYSDDERARREVEAESVAYIVANYFGLDPSNSAFYLAGWDADCEDTIQDRLQRISNTAEELITAVEPEEEDE